MRKRILALGLALCLLCSICPAAFAASDDYAAPVITSISMNAPGATVTVGDTLYFRMNVTDESPVSSAYLRFELYDVNGDSINSCYARMDSYDPETGVATLSLAISERMQSGVWSLSNAYASDFYENSCYILNDEEGTNLGFENCWFTVAGTSGDVIAPVITSLSMDEPGATVMVGDTLYFYMNATDESSVSYAYLRFELYDVNGDSINSCYARMDSYDPETGVATLSLAISERMQSGVWSLSNAYASDFYENSCYILNDEEGTNLGFENCWFTVAGTSGDVIAPVITSLSMDEPGATVMVGDTLYFYMNATDESSVSYAYLRFELYDVNGDSINSCYARMDSYDPETGVATLSLAISERMQSGVWSLSNAYASDFYENSCYILNDEEGTNLGFENCWFTVAHGDIIPTSVSIPEKITVSVRDVYTIRPDVEPVTALPDWTWTSSDAGIAEINSSANRLAALVTGVTPGVVTVTGTTANGLTDSCEVTVVDAPMPTGIEIAETYALDVDETWNIEPVLTPADATTLYEVTTDNPHVVEIRTTGGHTAVTITGVNAGHATITIRGSNQVAASAVVTVGQPGDRQHEKETVPAIEATCYREGVTSYLRCSACGYRFTQPQTIPMTDHKYGEWVIVKTATATEEGLRERRCENCGRWERETIPVLGDSGNETPGGGGSSGGNPDVGGSGGSSGGNPDVGGSGNSSSGNQAVGGSGNSSDEDRDGGDADTSADEDKRETLDIGSGSISAVVTDREAEISVTDQEISKIVRDGEKSGAVEVDVSELDVSAVSIPQDLITAVRDSEEVSTLSIKTGDGGMVIDADALDTIANALENEHDSISLGIETIDVDDIPPAQRYPIANVMNSAVFVTLSATVSHRDTSGNLMETEPLHELGGNVTISVPYERPDNMEGRQIIACYFGEDGAITYFPAKYENGIATFVTSHFSQFGVFASQAAAFTDVSLDAWYMTEVEFAMANQLMSGCGDGRFAPDAPLSRAMLAQILYNMAGRPRTDNRMFVDVPSGAWYYDAVTWAAANGIVGGYGNGLFGPDDPITREQLATVLYRFEQSQGGGIVNDGAFPLDYPDRDSVSGYAYEALCWCTMNGIITGMADGTLNPQGTATRVQSAAMLMRFVQNMEQ